MSERRERGRRDEERGRTREEEGGGSVWPSEKMERHACMERKMERHVCMYGDDVAS
jgi:hypothetical protein